MMDRYTASSAGLGGAGFINFEWVVGCVAGFWSEGRSTPPPRRLSTHERYERPVIRSYGSQVCKMQVFGAGFLA